MLILLFINTSFFTKFNQSVSINGAFLSRACFMYCFRCTAPEGKVKIFLHKICKHWMLQCLFCYWAMNHDLSPNYSCTCKALSLTSLFFLHSIYAHIYSMWLQSIYLCYFIKFALNFRSIYFHLPHGWNIKI